MRAMCLALLLVISGLSCAAEVKPFIAGSMASIEADHQGKPFVLLFWSLTCAYCPKELKMFAELQKKDSTLEVVLVATDSPEESAQINERLDHYGLTRAERWVFADAMQERLRFDIDKRWYGEVPRTYFYDRQHQREAKMGLVGQDFVEQWLGRIKKPD